MKKIFVGAVLALSFSFAGAKTVKTTLQAKGHCDQCKQRIENAAKSVKGVTAASWDKATQKLDVTFDDALTSKEEIAKALTASKSKETHKKCAKCGNHKGQGCKKQNKK